MEQPPPNASTSLVRDERGSEFVEMIIVIGIFCLVVGVAMSTVGDRIFGSFGKSADHVEETSLDTP